MSKPEPKKPLIEIEVLVDLEKWARACLADTKLYKGLQEAVEDLDKARAVKFVGRTPEDLACDPWVHPPDEVPYFEAREPWARMPRAAIDCPWRKKS
jgi:hypothetical protein